MFQLFSKNSEMKVIINTKFVFNCLLLGQQFQNVHDFSEELLPFGDFFQHQCFFLKILPHDFLTNLEPNRYKKKNHETYIIYLN